MEQTRDECEAWGPTYGIVCEFPELGTWLISAVGEEITESVRLASQDPRA